MYKICLLSIMLFSLIYAQKKIDIFQEINDHYVDNNGVKIHYVSLGKGSLVVMIHGFPDFWYTWRKQMTVLAKNYRVVAVDLRGYNKSDAPVGVNNYAMPLLISDIAAVIKDCQEKEAIVIAHDWGGMIAWGLAMERPKLVKKLIICNSPHPKGIARELANNPQQQKNSEYARRFQKENAHKNLTAEKLTIWMKDSASKKIYMEAFKRSSFEAMLNYYKANYPHPPYKNDFPLIKIKCPVLIIHGLDDKYLLSPSLNNTWKWIDNTLTIITIPGAGHFVHQDASEKVTRAFQMWLGQ